MFALAALQMFVACGQERKEDSHLKITVDMRVFVCRGKEGRGQDYCLKITVDMHAGVRLPWKRRERSRLLPKNNCRRDRAAIKVFRAFYRATSVRLSWGRGRKMPKNRCHLNCTTSVRPSWGRGRKMPKNRCHLNCTTSVRPSWGRGRRMPKNRCLRGAQRGAEVRRCSSPVGERKESKTAIKKLK